MFRRLLFFNFKLFFLLSQKLRQRFTANGLMIIGVMIAGGVFGIDTNTTLAAQIFAISLILLLIAAGHALFFKGRFNVSRILPEYGMSGQPVLYKCRIKNLNNKAVKQLSLIDDLQSKFPDYSWFQQAHCQLGRKHNRVDQLLAYPRLVGALRKLRGGSVRPARLEHIAGNSYIDAKLRLTPYRRGYIYFDRVRLASTDTLGLFNAQQVYQLNNKLLILPRLFNTPKLDLPGHRTYQTGETNRASLVGNSQEFISLRDYRPGDPLRSMHWRSCAKLGRPVIREYRSEYSIRYGLVLDTYINENTSHEQFEDAISVAASFMSSQTDADALVDLMFIGNQTYRYTSGLNHNNSHAIMEVLACLEPASEPNLLRLQGLLNDHVRECCGLLCILLAMDKERLALLRLLDDFKLPVQTLVITNGKGQTIAEHYENIDLHLLDINDMQADLDKLGKYMERK